MGAGDTSSDARRKCEGIITKTSNTITLVLLHYATPCYAIKQSSWRVNEVLRLVILYSYIDSVC